MTLRKDAMEILRVFNNNVVLAKGGDGGEVILTGRGLGFQAKPGQTVVDSQSCFQWSDKGGDQGCFFLWVGENRICAH